MTIDKPVIDFRLRIPTKTQLYDKPIPEEMALYAKKYHFEEKLELDTPDLLQMMDECNMPFGVLQAEVEFGEYTDVNNAVKKLHAQNMVVEMEDSVFGKVKVQGVPIKFNITPGSIDIPAPYLGQHNKEIYMSLGLSEKDLENLHAEGAI